MAVKQLGLELTYQLAADRARAAVRDLTGLNYNFRKW